MAILIGYVILVVNRVFGLNPIKPHLNWNAAQWLPVYLVGMGIIVYLSSFGPMKDPVIPLWWDIATVLVFSVIIYYWALNVALSTEEIEEMVEDYVPEEEDLGPAPAG